MSGAVGSCISIFLFIVNKPCICNDKLTGHVVLMLFSYAGQNIMKLKIAMLAVAVGALSFFTIESNGQERTRMSKEERDRMDSLQTSYRRDQEIQVQKENDRERMTDVKEAQRETKAKAKEARRVENEANIAARESRYALRAEKKAQKQRKQADAQAKKAARARIKSDNN